MKVSRKDENVANRVDAHLLRMWPELANLSFTGVPLWFTGSQVWRFLYDERPPPGSDTDVVLLGQDWYTDAPPLLNALGLDLGDGEPTYPKKDVVMSGYKFELRRGRLDIWVYPGTIGQALSNYPTESHSHCRAGYSFSGGLVVLRNEYGIPPGPHDDNDE